MRLSPRNGIPGALAVALAVVAGAPAAAATSGGTTAPPVGSTPATTAAPTGGTAPGATSAQPRDERNPRRKAAARPELVLFHANARRFYDLGRPARIAFRIDGRGKTVRVKLQLLSAGEVIRTLDLGDRATGRTHSISLTGREDGRLPEGTLGLRLSARDARGRGLSPSSKASSVNQLGFYWHRFPLTGSFTYGLDAGRFGAGRPGHIHQGQDVLAPAGTPIVAPRGGEITTVAYQEGGAGYYVVLRADDEDRTYVFMHLLEGSTRVKVGDRVATGQRLGDVGATGAASGPHLHFEEWVGAWYGGGHAIDPLPDLRLWDSWS